MTPFCAPTQSPLLAGFRTPASYSEELRLSTAQRISDSPIRLLRVVKPSLFAGRGTDVFPAEQIKISTSS